MHKNNIDNERTLRNSGSEPASMSDQPTTGHEAVLGMIDRYELISELGGGGFGSVFLARDTVADILVAIKGLPPMVKNIPEELERIRANFALVSQLAHPHIASLKVLHLAQHALYHDRFVKEKLRVMPGDYLVVMEYARGVTLSRWRRQFKDGRVSYDLAVEICRQIAEALDYAHTQKVAHRDIKPSNIMVESFGEVRECEIAGVLKCGKSISLPVSSGRNGRAENAPSLSVKVLDFGLAAEIRSSMSRVSQEKGDTSGTRPYMAPEQWVGARQDGYADQYALAVLFYELVTGAVPFAGVFETGDPVIMMTVVENRPPLSVAELAKSQNAALLRALAKQPAQRFSCCNEFVAAMAKGAKSNSREVSERKLFWFGVAGAAALVALVSMACWVIFDKSGQSSKGQERLAGNAEKQPEVRMEQVIPPPVITPPLMAVADSEAQQLKQAEKEARLAAEKKEADAKAAEKQAADAEAAEKRAADAKSIEMAKDAQRLKDEESKKAADAKVVLATDETQPKADEKASLVVAEAKRLKDEEDRRKVAEEAARLVMLRKGAEGQRDAANLAKTSAEEVKSAVDAKALFDTGGRTFSRAADVYAKGDFVMASNLWVDASVAYSDARKQASGAQKVRSDQAKRAAEESAKQTAETKLSALPAALPVAVAQDPPKTIALADGKWLTAGASAYALSRRERYPLLVFVYATGIDQQSTEPVMRMMDDPSVASFAKEWLLLVKVDLSSIMSMTDEEKQFARQLTQNNKVDKFPMVLLLNGSYQADHRYDSSDLQEGASGFVNALKVVKAKTQH